MGWKQWEGIVLDTYSALGSEGKPTLLMARRGYSPLELINAQCPSLHDTYLSIQLLKDILADSKFGQL